MKYSTAVNQIKKEAQFLGIGFMPLVQDVQKHGRMLYKERTIEAVQVYLDTYVVQQLSNMFKFK